MRKLLKSLCYFMLFTMICFCNYMTGNAEVINYEKYNGFVYTTHDTPDGNIVITNYTGGEKEITVPSEINGIPVTGIESLKGAKKLKTLHIPASITGQINISSAPVLAKVTIDNANPAYKVKNKLIVNKKVTEVYACPSGLTSVKIPDTVKTIEQNAFYKSRIKTITIPKKVTEIGISGFADCKNLSKITFNKKLKVIGSGAFDGCSALKNVSIPDSVESIADSAFAHCRNLVKVKLSKKLKYVGDIFTGSNKIKEVNIPVTVKKIDTCALQNCKKLKKVYIYNKKCKLYYDEKNSIFNAISSGITIYGYKGSTAEKYAKKNGNKFVFLK